MNKPEILSLLFPEWQGTGASTLVYSGARALCHSFFSCDSFHEVNLQNREELVSEAGIRGRSSILSNMRNARNIIDTRSPAKIFMIGGSCASELAPLSYLSRYYENNLTVLWLDAHGDLNTPESSPSGHFHGMILRTLMGEGDPELLSYVKQPLRPSQVTLAGVRGLDQPESEFITKIKIPVLSPEAFTEKQVILDSLKRQRSDNLYIHLDLDFFNPGDFKGSLFKEKGGLSLEQTLPVLSFLSSQFSLVGFSIVECASVKRDETTGLMEMLSESRIFNHFDIQLNLK